MSKLELDNIIFIGRTFDEYLAMFKLTKEELEGKKILDCPRRSLFF
ncbi:MAG: hypothetical protein PHE67_14425 [Campylobacterales bacterium]|nr:hypothetical protein [Campylobacterales bacterium]